MDPVQFGRSIAQFVKQMIRSDLHEFSRKRITDLFKEKEKQLITVRVKQLDTGRGTVAVDYEGTELYLNKNEQIPNEILREGDLIQVLVTQIVNSEKKDKRPIVRISRSDRDIIRRLFERAVPEILDGTVTIHAVSREPGFRSKIAVSSNDPDVEAIGACIGPHGSRIDTVLQELHGEKIDIIPYSEDKTEFIIRALAPAKVTSATLGLDEHGKDMATVIVPDDQQSLAIGNRGLNAKLAAKLTDCKIDIKSESETVDREEEADFVEDMAEDTAEAAFDDAPIDFDVAEMDSTSAVE